MAQLTLVSDYIAEARRLLQDEYAASYRYSDASIIEALNVGLLEARRLRADLFYPFSTSVPAFTSGGETVPMDQQYRSALLYYIVGRIELRDGEENTEQRAAAFLNKFTAQLLSITS